MPGPFLFCLTLSEANVLQLLTTEEKPRTIPELLATGKTTLLYRHLYYRLTSLQTAGLVIRRETKEIMGGRPVKVVQWEITATGRKFLQR